MTADFSTTQQIEPILKWDRDEISHKRDLLYGLAKDFSAECNESAFLFLANFLKERAPHRVYMQFCCIYYEGINDFRASQGVVKEVYEANKWDQYVGLRLARVSLALAELSDVTGILDGILARETSDELTLKCAEVCADATLFSEARLFLKTVKGGSQNEERTLSVLKKRCATRTKLAASLGEDIPEVLFVNLERDFRKKRLLETLYKNLGLKPRVVNGVDGKHLPESVFSILSAKNQRELTRGTVGCFLGHVEAWHRLLDLNIPGALILEDDGLPFCDLTHHLHGLLASDCDIVFVNERLSSLRGSSVVLEGEEAVYERLGQLPETQKGWGADGYFVSRDGAEKLIEYLREDGIVGHADGQIVSYAISGRYGDPKNHAQRVARMFMGRFKGRRGLSSSCLNFPLVHEVNFGKSSRLGY